MKCGGRTHRILWKNGSLVLLDHPKEQRESDKTMLELGAKMRCYNILELWRQSIRYENIHHAPWIPKALIPPLEEAIGRASSPFWPLAEPSYPWATPKMYRLYFEHRVQLLAGDAYSHCRYREPAGDICQQVRVYKGISPEIRTMWGRYRGGRRELHTSIYLPYRWYREVYLTGNAIIDGCFVVEYIDDELVLAGRPARQGCLIRTEKARVIVGLDGNRHLDWLRPYRSMSVPRTTKGRQKRRWLGWFPRSA